MMRGATMFLCVLGLAMSGACTRQAAPSGARALGAIVAAGLPTTAGEMVREPGERACPGGGHKRTQLETLRAHGDTREVRTTITYAACQVGATTLNGMLFTRLTHTSDLGAAPRIFGNVDGEVSFTGDVTGACEVALTVEAAKGLGGSVCGAEVEAADIQEYITKPGWPGSKVPKSGRRAGS